MKQTLNRRFSTQYEVARASAQVRGSVSKMDANISKAVTELKTLTEQEAGRSPSSERRRVRSWPKTERVSIAAAVRHGPEKAETWYLRIRGRVT